MNEAGRSRSSSRRDFLAGAAGAAVGAGALGALSASGAAATPAPGERKARYVHPRIDPPRPAHPVYRRSLFEGARGGRVVVRLEGGPVMRYGERPVYEAIINRAYYRRMNG